MTNDEQKKWLPVSSAILKTKKTLLHINILREDKDKYIAEMHIEGNPEGHFPAFIVEKGKEIVCYDTLDKIVALNTGEDKMKYYKLSFEREDKLRDSLTGTLSTRIVKDLPEIQRLINYPGSMWSYCRFGQISRAVAFLRAIKSAEKVFTRLNLEFPDVLPQTYQRSEKEWLLRWPTKEGSMEYIAVLSINED